MGSDAPPRVRLTKHIDLTKAKPGCKGCNGRGVNGYKTADLGDGNGEQQIPIICRCVTRNNGVQPDKLDKVMADAKAQIDDGVFHENMAADLKGMPYDAMIRTVSAFMCDVVNTEKSRGTRDAVGKTIDLISKWENWKDIRVDAMRILMRDANDPTLDNKQKTLVEKAMTRVRSAMN